MSSVEALLKGREEQYPQVVETPLISVVIPVFNESAIRQLEKHRFNYE